ncbi:MAG: ribosome recycling factor [Bdellovibrionales bacterium]|nr:ribosome recycling factor [Bdellovibrionales bacterium]
MSKQILDQFGTAADKSLAALKNELTKVRTGRASTALVEPVQVDYYGSMTPLTQVANVTTPDARTIQIAPWENSMIAAIEKAIHAANIGLTPQSDGKVVRISVPAMTEERRKEMVKLIKKIGEDSKVAIRNSRRDSNEAVKAAEKAKTVTEDESKKFQEQIQKKTDEKVAEVDKLITAKEKEIMTI